MVDNNSPLVSIVILNWNGLEDTKNCLEHVRKLNYPNYEIIVVDNGSSQGDKKYLSNLKDITYIDNPKNRGFSGGQIDGYKKAKGDFILLLNNDAAIDANYLGRAMPLFEDPSVAVVGGRSYFWNDEEQVLKTSNRFYAYMNVDPVTAETSLQMDDSGAVEEVNVVSGSAVVVRKSITEKTGYLWEPFFAYYEETDLFARIKRAGYKILYNPNLHIWHKNGASSGAQDGSLFFYYHIFRNRYMFAIRNFDDDYFELFKKSYYSSFKKSLRDARRGKNERTIARAYLKAVKYIKEHEEELQSSRNELKESLKGGQYSQRIIKEQIRLSVVIDATKLDLKETRNLYKNVTSKHTPRTEYVIITNHEVLDSSTLINPVRYLVNRNFFDTHPINLGLLAAKYEWMVACASESLKEVEDYINLIVDSFTKKPKAIHINSTSLLLKKELFELIGGFTKSSSSLSKNITYIKKYSFVDDSLIGTKDISLPDAEIKDISSQVYADRDLLSLNQTTRWQHLLSRHYRLQQLTNLITWGAHPRIKSRVKLGRTKNLILHTASLNREKLAIELKHIRNEITQQGKYRRISVARKNLEKETLERSKKQLTNIANIPVFIICFERVNDLSLLVKKLEKLGLKKIVFIDNNSSYPPLINYLSSTPYQVIELGRNVGHTSPWSLGVIRSLAPKDYYIVTDPDVLPTDECIMANPVERMIAVHKKYRYYFKVGLSLKINDLPDHYPLKKEVIQWESQFWIDSLEDGVFAASVDTTFALYKPATYTYLLGPSIRLGDPFSARHMPWYSNPSDSTEEDSFYKNRANSEVTSWNLDELPDRYKKEMKTNE